MRTQWFLLAGLAVVVALAGFAAHKAEVNLTVVKAEPNLEKRAELALQYTSQVMNDLAKDYRAGRSAQVAADLDALGESVDLCYQSLQDTGKDPRGNKHYKRAEMETRELARRLTDFAAGVDLEERAPVERLRDRVLKVHDDLLEAIMVRKKKTT